MLNREQIIASLIVWGVIILVLGLAVELVGWERIAPWVTLSETAWWIEKAVPIMQSIFFGFLIGLAVHIRFHTKFGHAELGGILIALIVHGLWGLA